METRVGTDRLGRASPLRELGGGDWARIAAWIVVVAVLIAVPTRLVPNDLFRRMTPTRPLDYAFWVLGAGLTGAVLGLRRRAGSRREATAVAGGLGTALAVGCPVCNKVVVALIGAGGATNLFAPLQPVLGTASIALLVWALRSQLRAMSARACAVPPI